jgi:uncharacterized protein (TIGR03000 family)
MYSVVMMMALSGGTEVADFGRRGCRGGCSGAYACSGCYGGGCQGCYGGYSSCRGGYGCYGGPFNAMGCYGGGCCGGRGTPPSGATPGTPPPSRPAEKVPVPPQKTSADDRASIIVTLPTDAKLTFDARPTASTSETRWFISPVLQRGSNYQYQLRAEIVRNGVPQVLTRTILVRANEETRVSLDFSNVDVAARR